MIAADCRNTLIIFLWVFLSCINSWGGNKLNDDPPIKKNKNTRSFDGLIKETNTSSAISPSFFIQDYAAPVSDDQQKLRAKIQATYDKVFKENRFVEFLDQNSLLDLPIGIKADLGVLTYSILIDSVVMTSKESFLYASMVFETPQGKKIHFMGSDIKFSKTGGLTGDAKLMLVGDYPIALDSSNQLVIKGSNKKTFVEFDCRGYKQLSLDASLLFSREMLLPEDGNGKISPQGNVSVDFTTTITDWNDILVNVNVPKFQVKNVNDVTFSITDAVLDFSDTRNPGAIQFPQGYAQISPMLIDGNMNLWQGVYIRDLTVTLPPHFETKAEQGQQPQKVQRISFKGNNLIIDPIGFSGKLSANNLIPIEKGKLGNWPFSLETISISFAANEIKEGAFAGKVNIPINKQDEQASNAATDKTVTSQKKNSKVFSYSALIQPNNQYAFTVSNLDTLNFALWKADVQLHPSSRIEIALSNGKFLPKAHLNGMMTMNIGLKEGETSTPTDKNKKVKMAKVTFQDLEIQSVKPYVKIGTFSLGTEGGDSGMGGFPIAINGISGSSSGNTITLAVDLTLGLIKESDGGFAANGRFSIISESVEQGDELSYRFSRLEIDRFGVDIDKGSFKFKGNLNFYKEDAVYGNGISGTVDATFNPGVQIQASAIFGTKNNSRYWYADALASFNSGITIFTGVAIYSFGGGAYYKMKMADKGVGSALGKTVSGIVYVPDETMGFGFKATIGIGVQPGKNSFNADATYEMAFYADGGVKYINFRGNGYFLTPPTPVDQGAIKDKSTKLAAASEKSGGALLNEKPEVAEQLYGSPSAAGEKAQVWASVMINYDFDHHVLHGNMNAFVNVSDGLIKGVGPNGKAGEVVMHFAPGEWYIYIGRPEYENRFAVEVLGLARLDSYFVMGTVIPHFPAPPEKVLKIVNQINRDLPGDVKNGTGVGFGSSFSFDTGDINYALFYGRFAAGLGFDVMLEKSNIECEGRGARGINGWYASGQAYAFFEGTIGIKVTILKKTKKVNILELGAAVIAQAELPNPVWIKGVAGGYFNVLGGLVKGNYKFEIEIGERCKPIKSNSTDSPLKEIEVLAQATPQTNAQSVDVFTLPQAVFNYEMEKEYEMVDENDQTIKFKISLDQFTVKDNGKAISAELKWNDDKTVAALNPFEILPSEKELTLEIVASFKENRSGYWIVSTVAGEPLTEKHTLTFKTGKAPDYIPANNIAYSYPLDNQFNYYKNETSEGYINLKQGQDYLFANTNEWSPVVRYQPKAGQRIDVPLSYIAGAKELRFALPQNLGNDQIIEWSVVNVPRGALNKIDSNVDTVSTKVASGADLELGVRTRTAEGTIKESQEKKLYGSYLRISKYNTFRDKMISVNPSSGWRDPIIVAVHAIGSNMGGPEPFSYQELPDDENHIPLVQIEADLNNVPWYNDAVYPIVYQDYPINGSIQISSSNRKPDVLGIVPVKGVYLYQVPWQLNLTTSDSESGTVSLPSWVGRIDYYLAWYMYKDYLDLANQAANYVAQNGSSARLNKLVTSTFPVIRGGDYWININYRLPGRNTITSTYRHKIHNPID